MTQDQGELILILDKQKEQLKWMEGVLTTVTKRPWNYDKEIKDLDKISEYILSGGGEVIWAEFTFPPLNLININKTIAMQQIWFNEELLELWKRG